jgi:hypothetical protein
LFLLTFDPYLQLVFECPLGVIVELQEESEVEDLVGFNLADLGYHSDLLKGYHVQHIFVELLFLFVFDDQLFPGAESVNFVFIIAV